MVRGKKNKCWKTYIPKKQKGNSITERPKSIVSKEEFGHWEGDLVTGPRDGQKGAYLTLLERKTRFYLMLPIPRKSSKHVYMMINRLNRFYGDSFSNIFRSITFDNGSEFARWKDIEIKPGTRKRGQRCIFDALIIHVTVLPMKTVMAWFNTSLKKEQTSIRSADQ